MSSRIAFSRVFLSLSSIFFPSSSFSLFFCCYQYFMSLLFAHCRRSLPFISSFPVVLIESTSICISSVRFHCLSPVHNHPAVPSTSYLTLHKLPIHVTGIIIPPLSLQLHLSNVFSSHILSFLKQLCNLPPLFHLSFITHYILQRRSSIHPFHQYFVITR